MSLNNLLKQQIKDAIAHIYDESGPAADNRYTKPEDLSKALLDILFPAEKEENTQITGVVQVPVDTESDGSTDSKRKKRAPMSDEAKAAMKAKRAATIAAKAAAAPAPAPAAEEPKPEEPKSDTESEKKARKPRGPMSDEAKAAMKAKREATLAAKKAAQA
jgi:hypothetical protein